MEVMPLREAIQLTIMITWFFLFVCLFFSKHFLIFSFLFYRGMIMRTMGEKSVMFLLPPVLLLFLPMKKRCGRWVKNQDEKLRFFISNRFVFVFFFFFFVVFFFCFVFCFVFCSSKFFFFFFLFPQLGYRKRLGGEDLNSMIPCEKVFNYFFLCPFPVFFFFSFSHFPFFIFTE